MRVTRKAIERAIKQATGDDIEVCQGNGYVYFWGSGLESWTSTSVAICRISHASIERWVSEYIDMKKAYENSL